MQKICFNKDWRFKLGSSPYLFFSGSDNKTAEKIVDLPHDFMVELKRDPKSPAGSGNGYFPGGLGYYSKTFFAPDDWKNKDISVEFEGVYMNVEIRLNNNVINRQN